MRRILVVAVCVLVFAGAVYAAPRSAWLPKTGVEIVDLRADINTLNLINGLFLNDQQMVDLLAVAREVKALRDDIIVSAEADLSGLDAPFRELRANLINNSMGVSPELERNAREAKERVEVIHERYRGSSLNQEKAALRSRLDTILTPGQISIINDFKPCLIPPKSLKNPSRVGQANDSGRFEKLLERVRGIPEQRYRDKLNKIMQRYFEGLEKHHITLTYQQKEQESARVLGIFAEARSIDDTSFELNKSELAERLDPINNGAFMKDRAPKRHIDKVARYFLNPRIIPLLEAKIEAGR